MRLPRAIALTALSSAAALAAVLALAHLPIVRERVLAFALERLRDDFGVAATVQNLSYNLLTLDVTAVGIEAAATESPTSPFLRADSLRLDASWRWLGGTVSLDALEASGLAISVVSSADGATNLPTIQSTDDSGGTLDRVELGRLIVRNASLAYRDEAAGLAADVKGLDLTLEPRGRGEVAGRIVTTEGISVRSDRGDLEGTLDGELAYDGATLTLSPLTFDSPTGRLAIDGRLGDLWSAPTSSLALEGRLELAAASSMLQLDPPARGAIEVKGTVDGPLTAVTAAVSMDGHNVAWRHLEPAEVRIGATLTPEAARLDRVSIALGGGTLAAKGGFEFEANRASVAMEWQGLTLASLAGPDLPLPIDSRLSGRVEAGWNLSAGLPGLRANADLRTEPTGDRSSALAGASSFELADGAWTLKVDHTLGTAARLAGDVDGRLEGNDPLAAQVGGTISVTSEDLGALSRRAGVLTPEWLDPAGGRLAARFRVAGSLGSPSLTGGVQLDGLRVGSSDPIQIESSLAASLDRVAIESLRVALGANVATLRGTLDLERMAIGGEGDIDVGDLSGLAELLAPGMNASGTITSHVEVSGNAAQPTVRGTIDGAGLGLASQPIGNVSAEIAYAKGTVSVPALEIRQPEGGTLTAKGEFTPAGGDYVLDARISAFSLRQEGGGDGASVAATIDGTFQGRGTLARAAGSGRLVASNVTWNDIAVERAQADVVLADGRARLDVQVPDFKTTAGATIQMEAPYQFSLDGAVDDADLAPFIPNPAGSVPMEGQLRARLTAEGNLQTLADVSARADLERLDIRSGDARLQLPRPASLQYTDGRITVRDLSLVTGAASLEASGEIGVGATAASLDLSIRGDAGDFRPWLIVGGLPPEVTIGGRIEGNIAAKGDLESPDLAGRFDLQDLAVDWPGYSPLSGNLQVSLAEGAITVARLDASWQGARASFQAGAPLQLFAEWLPAPIVAGLPASSPAASPTGRLVGRIDGLSHAVLEPFAGDALPEDFTAEASLAIDLRADRASLDAVTGTVALESLGATVAGLPLAQVRPTRVEIADGALRIIDWAWTLAGSPIDVAGRVSPGEEGLDLTVGGRLDLRTLAAFVPGATSSGQADVFLRVTGPVASPLAAGAVELRGGELRMADPPIALAELRGRVSLNGDRVELAGVAGTLNGGAFTVTGDVLHEQLGLTGGSLTFSASGITLNIPSGMRTEIDSELTLALAERPRLTGRVTIARGAYREPLSLAAGLVSAARLRTVPASGGAPSAFLDQLDLEVVVASTQDLVVDNNYGRMEIGVDVRLVGTAARPSVVGRATIREGGVLYLGGRTYQVERGAIDFTNPRAIVPDLDLSARTTISGYDITLEITGTPETVKATLASDPVLGQSDIASLLVTGRRTDQIGGASTEIARDQVLGYLSGETLGFAARAVGLDTIRLDRGFATDDLQSDPSLVAGDVDPAARLTLSKRVSRTVEVTLSQNLRDSGLLTWIAAYEPGRAVELRVVSRDDRSRSYEVRHSVSFVGPPPESDAGGSSRGEPPRVAEVRFSGDPGATPAELLRSLDLRPGDRFDFYRWQDDRMRLRKRYLDRGHLEAQVRATREEVSSPRSGTLLEYEIDPGPLARLEIAGAEVPASLVAELKDVWSNAIFDEALRSELTLAVRRHFVRRNQLRAEVAVSIQPAPEGEKHVRVDIAPGEPTGARVVRFVGNAQIDTTRIEALLDESSEVEAWLTPAALARDVLTVYRDEGFLAARAQARPIVFEGSRALLPIEIVEGPSFVISDLVINNVRARGEAEVRRTFGLMAGDRYTAEAVARARVAVEADYATQGFNAVSVTVDTTADAAAARVTIVVEVDEGPRQMLETIAVDGAAGVRPGVVEDALTLETGTPVNMATWYEARRRLLDTGLFQRVELDAVPLETAGDAGVQPVRAQVSLRRWPRWRLRYGLQVTDETAPASEGRDISPGVSADLQRRGLWGRPGTFGAALRASRNDRIGRTFLTLPTFFGLPVASSLFVTRSREFLSEGGFLSITADRTAFTAEQRFRPRPAIQVAYGYHIEQKRTVFGDLAPGDPLSTIEARQARLTSTVLVDTRDDPFGATRGVLHSSAIEYAPGALGADARFVKYFGQQFVYHSLTPRVIIASAVRLGAGRGFGQRLIPSERFFAGGLNTVRGYEDDSLGGVDFFGDPVSGQATLVLNQEIRFPMWRWLGGAGFVDAGNVFSQASDLSLGDLAVGIGAGLRISTPVGLFRLDLGVPAPRDGRPPQWHFTFGQMF